jgi:hypothetical protein
MATGGRLGEQPLDEILGETIERRTRRRMEAPVPFGEFLAYQFGELLADATPGTVCPNNISRPWRLLHCGNWRRALRARVTAEVRQVWVAVHILPVGLMLKGMLSEKPVN